MSPLSSIQKNSVILAPDIPIDDSESVLALTYIDAANAIEDEEVFHMFVNEDAFIVVRVGEAENVQALCFRLRDWRDGGGKSLKAMMAEEAGFCFDIRKTYS